MLIGRRGGSSFPGSVDYFSGVAKAKVGLDDAITGPTSFGIRFKVPDPAGTIAGGLSTMATRLEFTDGTNTASLDTELKAGADVLVSVGLNDTTMQLKRIVTGQMWKKRRGTCLAAEYATNAAIIGTETVTSKGGTATVTVSAGRVTFGAGTLWSLVLSNGSQYEYPVLIHPSIAMWYDVSGYGRHLTAIVADAANHCTTDWDDGSDWLDSNGFTVGENLHVLRKVENDASILTTRVDLDTFKYERISVSSAQHYIPIGDMAGQVVKAANTVYGAKFKIKAIEGAVNTSVALRFSASGTSIQSVSDSGPGTAVINSSTFVIVTGLSATEWTEVTMIGTGWVSGTTVLGHIRLWASTNGATLATQLGGCIVNELQIFEGSAAPAYTPMRSCGVWKGAKAPVLSKEMTCQYSKITCIGDSITEGVGYPKYKYPDVLEDLLPGTVVFNKGVGGNYTSHIIARLADITATNADAYIVLCGVNDAMDNAVALSTIQANYTTIINALAATGADIYICEITPCKNTANWSEADQIDIDGINAWIPSLGYPVIPTYAALESPSDADALFSGFEPSNNDHLHLGKFGAEALAACIANYIADNSTTTAKVSATGQPYTAPESLDSAVTTFDGTLPAWEE